MRGLHRPDIGGARPSVQRRFDDVGRRGKIDWIALMPKKYKDREGERRLPYRPSRLRLYMGDAQTILRHGLRTILDAEPDLEVIGEASNMQDAVALSRRFLPDVLIPYVAFSNV